MSWLDLAREHLGDAGFEVWEPGDPRGPLLLADNGNLLVVLVRADHEAEVRRIAHGVRHAARSEGANRLVVVFYEPPDDEARRRWLLAMAARDADPDLLIVDLPAIPDPAVLAPLAGLGPVDAFLRAVEDNELVSAIGDALSRLGVPDAVTGALAADLHVFLEGGHWYGGASYPQTRAALGLS